MTGTILIVSAWEPEQSHLRSLAATANATPHRALLNRCQFLLCGVGPVRAAAAVARFLACNEEIELVVFVGTAGCYVRDGMPRIGSAVEAKMAVGIDGAQHEGRAYIPTGHEIALHAAAPSAHAICACPPSITGAADLAAALAKNFDLENLELAGVAWAAASVGIPWRAWLGVANHVGPDAHAEWKAHHVDASLAAQLALLSEV